MNSTKKRGAGQFPAREPEQKGSHRSFAGAGLESDPTMSHDGSVCFRYFQREKLQTFGESKRALDKRSGVTGWRLHDFRRTIVSGMARLGVPPHVADKILNHQAGTISGVAAVYQRHDFLLERKEALDRWNSHVSQIIETFNTKR